ncbi:beta-hexosaminidase, partial [bacterium LRH843]|nr:beta-hexosaminidase [bacterium LRH843]
NGSLADKQEVAAAAGCMDADGQRRAEAALAARKQPDEVDIPALEAKLDALLNG